eukprot:SAG31_NODE_169_length_21415_cov_29.765338_3_plen_172_part_00
MNQTPVPRPKKDNAARKQVQDQRKEYEASRGTTPRQRVETQQATKKHTFVLVNEHDEKQLVAALPPHLAKLVAKQQDKLPPGVSYSVATRSDRVPGSAAGSADTVSSPAKTRAQVRYQRALKMIKQAATAQTATSAALTAARENLQKGVIVPQDADTIAESAMLSADDDRR